MPFWVEKAATFFHFDTGSSKAVCLLTLKERYLVPILVACH